MGSRAGYTLLTGLFIGLGGMLGVVSFIVELIPRAVIAPILVFVALEITSQAFLAYSARHAPAVALAFIPSLAQLVLIKLSNPEYVSPERFQQLLSAPGAGISELLVIVALANGFIFTALLWGAFLAKLIDRQLRSASAYLSVCAGLAFFGVIHSAIPAGSLYLPWHLADPARRVPYQFSLAYVAVALLFFLFSFTVSSREPVSST